MKSKIKPGIQTVTLYGKAVVPYTQSGTYKKDQIVYHPKFGLGTVLRLRYGKVEIQFSSEARKRTFLCGMMTHDQRNEANGLPVTKVPSVAVMKPYSSPMEGLLLQEGSRRIEADDIPFSMESFMNQLLDCNLDDAS